MRRDRSKESSEGTRCSLFIERYKWPTVIDMYMYIVLYDAMIEASSSYE